MAYGSPGEGGGGSSGRGGHTGETAGGGFGGGRGGPEGGGGSFGNDPRGVSDVGRSSPEGGSPSSPSPSQPSTPTDKPSLASRFTDTVKGFFGSFARSKDKVSNPYSEDVSALDFKPEAFDGLRTPHHNPYGLGLPDSSHDPFGIGVGKDLDQMTFQEVQKVDPRYDALKAKESKFTRKSLTPTLNLPKRMLDTFIKGPQMVKERDELAAMGHPGAMEDQQALDDFRAGLRDAPPVGGDGGYEQIGPGLSMPDQSHAPVEVAEERWSYDPTRQQEASARATAISDTVKDRTSQLQAEFNSRLAAALK